MERKGSFQEAHARRLEKWLKSQEPDDPERRIFLKSILIAAGGLGVYEVIANQDGILKYLKSQREQFVAREQAKIDPRQQKEMEKFTWGKRKIESEGDLWKYTEEAARLLKEEYDRRAISDYIGLKNGLKGKVYPGQEIEIPVGYKK